MARPSKAIFEINLNPRTNAASAARLVATAAAIGLLATGAVYLTWVFSIRFVFYIGMIGVAGVAFIVAWRKRDRTHWSRTGYIEELGEATRRINRFHIRMQRAFAALLAILGAVSVGLTVAGVGTVFFAPMIFVFPAIGYWAWRIADRRDAAERIDDPHLRLAARSDAMARLQQETIRVVSVLLGLIATVWIHRNLLGIWTPAWIGFWMSGFVFMPVILYLGMMAANAGLPGRWVQADPHCVACGYAYDADTKPDLCPECGGEMNDANIATWRRRRHDRLAFLGVALISIAVVMNVVRFSPTVGAVILTKASTIMLINQIADGSTTTTAGVAWAELQTRMPLQASDRDRLIERMVSRAIAGDTLLFYARPGLDIWLSENWPGSGAAGTMLDRLLTHVESQLAAGFVNYEMSEAAEVLFLMPAAEVSPDKRERMLRTARRVLKIRRSNDYSMSGAQTAAQAWIDAGAAAGILKH